MSAPSTTVTEPRWAVPPVAALDDVRWLALAEVRRTQSPPAAGIHATLCWVRGLRREAPVSERTERPVTAALAESELIAAMIAGDPDGYLLDGSRLLQRTTREVKFRPAVASHPGYDLAVWNALRWVTGEGGQRAPYRLPSRNPDGTPRTADELYRDALAAHPVYATVPESRERLRNEADQEARMTRYLADAITDAQARGPGTRPLRAS
jgi:hypothetical protein